MGGGEIGAGVSATFKDLIERERGKEEMEELLRE